MSKHQIYDVSSSSGSKWDKGTAHGIVPFCSISVTLGGSSYWGSRPACHRHGMLASLHKGVCFARWVCISATINEPALTVRSLPDVVRGVDIKCDEH